MANYASGVNPIILKWAREKAGYSPEEIAKAFNKDLEIILAWEKGDAVPTYNQLERLAYSFYKRPLALFFFPEPPDEPDPGKSFRTLPESEIENFQPDTLIAVREGKAMQLSLHELYDGHNPSDRKIFQDLRIPSTSDPYTVAVRVREYLGVSLDVQIKWSGVEDALKNWRNIIEGNGIFVFKRSFKQEDLSGFCLVDVEFPIIYLNNSTSKSRQIFSIFHELAHIMLSTSGVTKNIDTYIGSLTGEARAIEIFCNQFAGEFLVPSDDFDKKVSLDIPIEKITEQLSRRYKVSREVILRKLLDRQIIGTQEYRSLVDKWLDEYEEFKSKRSGGGNYYATQATYLGERFLSLVFSRYYEGSLTVQQVAEYMNIKAKSVEGMEQYLPQ